jgi:SAM-dependent methyltransferase
MKPKGHTWSHYIRNGLGLKLSKLGELFGIDALKYNSVILELFHSIAVKNAPKVVAAVQKVFPDIRSAIDVGCGSGAFAAEFLKRGVATIGLEYSRHGVALAKKQGVDARPFDVRKPINDQIRTTGDLAYSFEVAEHVPLLLADKFVSIMTTLAPLVIFTAAQPGQGGIGHINEQPLNYWISRFQAQGFELAQTETERLREALIKREASSWFPRNVCVFRRRL